MMLGGERDSRSGQMSRRHALFSVATISPTFRPIWGFTIYAFPRFGQRKPRSHAQPASKAFVIGTIGLRANGCLSVLSMKCCRRVSRISLFAWDGQTKHGRVFGMDHPARFWWSKPILD